MLSAMAKMIIQGEFIVDPADTDKFLEASIPGIVASRAEDGCIEYVMAADPVVPGRIVLSERWESGEALGVHGKGPNVKPPADRPRPLSASVVIYEVASETRLV